MLHYRHGQSKAHFICWPCCLCSCMYLWLTLACTLLTCMQPEMSHNVQKYDKNVYLRVSEAQRCRVHSTLMVPVFGSGSRDKALAVFELVQVRASIWTSQTQQVQRCTFQAYKPPAESCRPVTSCAMHCNQRSLYGQANSVHVSVPARPH